MRRESGILWIAAAATLWGTDTVLRRPLTGTLHPTQIVLYEHAILALLVAPIVIRGRAHLKEISGRVWAAVIGTAWIGSALATVLFTAAIQSGSPTTAVLLQKTQPLFAIMLARAVLRERLPARFPLIAGIAILGAYLVAFGDGNLLAPASSFDVLPALLAIGAAVGWASATIWGRIAAAEIPFELVTALRVLCALPVLFIAAAVQHQTSLPMPGQFVSLAVMALVPGFIALLLYYRGLRNTPASQATIAELAFPATASLLNWLVLGFTASGIQILGFIVVWGAIFNLSLRMNWSSH
jgi:drug/metabolite transporter, DME family